jgi:ABC-2 type transport system permease protein
MRNTLTIAGRQFRSYFNGPAAYIVAAIVLGFVGAIFWYYFFLIGRTSAREMFMWMGRSMVFAAPAIAMGLLAEERRSGTLELLVTMPVREIEVILGKYLGALGMVAVIIALTVAHPLAVSTLGDLSWGPVLGGYVGLFLAAAAMLAIGVMASSWTENQLVAFFISFFLLIMFTWIPLIFERFFTGTMATVVQVLSFDAHLESMAKGVVDTRDIIFFLSIIVVSLMVAFRALERRRWS